MHWAAAPPAFRAARKYAPGLDSVRPCCVTDDKSVFGLRDCAGEVAVLLALHVVMGFCNREYSTKLIFELVDGLWSDHAIEPGQFVSEGIQRIICLIACGRCHFWCPFIVV